MFNSRLHIEIDKLDRNSWDHLITQFDDASLFQTWSYAVSGPKTNVSTIVVKREEDILGCCLVNLRQLPFFKIGIAYIKWGPLCIKKGGLFEPDVLSCLMHAIKEEYAIKRGYLLRIWPHATGGTKELLKRILEMEGFRSQEGEDVSKRPYRSLRIDLSPAIDELRKNLNQEWRRHLCRAEDLYRAEANRLNLIEGTDIELFDTLVRLAKEGAKIKKFSDLTNYESYRRTQEGLPEPLKIKFVVCEVKGEPVCAAGYSAIGDPGFFSLAGTGGKAYEVKATYLVQWRMIERLKESGVHYYDLGPFNRERNPGVYSFKRGIAGKKGWEETFLREYQGFFNLRGRMAKFILEWSQYMQRILSKQNNL